MKKRRLALLAVIFFGVCGLFVFRLVKLQLIEGEDYLEQSMTRVVTKTEVSAARGEILDRYCRPLVGNEATLSVGINLKTCKDLNGVIAETVRIFESYGQEYPDNLPISVSSPHIYTTETLSSTFRTWLSNLKISEGLTAEETLEKLVRYYGLEDLSPSLARAVVGVRYEMYRKGASSTFVFAQDVPISVVSALRERRENLVGVEISSDYTRVYSDTDFASHILGYTGSISSAEYEKYKDAGYSISDDIGKAGIEKYCEDYLRGTDGYRYYEVNAAGTVTTELTDRGKSEVSGDTIVLTIDKMMQKRTEESLAEALKNVKILNGEDAGTSASAVFIEIATGEILSMASDPYYNPATFYEDYAQLSQSASSPYVNRAISGAFPPGSTWKIITAIAGLEEGVITPQTTYTCTGVYHYYESYQPTCNNRTAHGTVNVSQALQKSCNCFFYEVGRLIGSDKLAEYAERFGFGSKTGIELPGEISGTVASKALRESQGGIWQNGESLLAAIGQTDNTATPLQLAVLAATVANDGVRLQPRLIKARLNRETGESVLYEPVVVGDLGISSETLDAVKSGMYKVTNEVGGTAYRPFEDYTVVQVCAKSGTAETPPGQACALFIGYAPAENPVIAFSVVIEHGGNGAYNYTTQVVKDVLSYYFTERDVNASLKDVGTLLP